MANTVVEATVLHATDEYVDFVHLSWSELARRTWREVIEDDVLGLAAQLSYYFFLALFPAILFLLAVASFFPLSNITDDVGRSLGLCLLKNPYSLTPLNLPAVIDRLCLRDDIRSASASPDAPRAGEVPNRASP
jgi:hypothetical protein